MSRTIRVGLSDVASGFENLPLGEYLGDIQSATYQETDKPGKFDQIKVTYLVVDGDALGKIQSEWLSLSPKAAFRLKKWFAKFPDLDEGAVDDLEFDDSDEMSEPDIIGTRVIFKVYKERDKRVADETADDAYQVKATLVSVEDESLPQPKAKAKAEPEPEAEDDEPEDEVTALKRKLAELEGQKEEAKPAAKAPKAAAAAPQRKLR